MLHLLLDRHQQASCCYIYILQVRFRPSPQIPDRRRKDQNRTIRRTRTIMTNLPPSEPEFDKVESRKHWEQSVYIVPVHTSNITKTTSEY